MEAISHAGTTLGIASRSGIVLAAERRVTSKLLDPSGAQTEKIYTIAPHLCAAVAGITSDANLLVQYARRAALGHEMTYGEPLACEHLAQQLCDMKQSYTQYGGLRPFGVSFLYAGLDNTSDDKGQWGLYHSDPSGNYAGWKAHCIGANAQAAQGILKQDYKDDMDMDEVMALVFKVMYKTLESTSLTSEKLEVAVMQHADDPVDTKRVTVRVLTAAEVDALLKKYKPEKTSSSSSSD